MTVLEQIAAGIKSGREEFAHIMENTDAPGIEAGDDSLASAAFHSGNRAEGMRSMLSLGDNLEYMKKLIEEGYRGRFRTIYIDPPFFTKSKFNAAVSVRDSDGNAHKIRHLAFDDRFERSLECYIENMSVRILMMRELLASDGLLWVHLDWHSSHYIRLVMDELLGDKNFVNEIVWCYKSGGSAKKHFSRKHDVILVYSKSRSYHIAVPEEKSYNRGFKPYNFKGVKEYRDENGWYTLVNMKDVWNIDMVGRTSAERNGYATQKPLELMKRIIEAGSEEGDLVGDFFCGSGSFLEAADMLGRRWAGCDSERLAASLARKRLISRGSEFTSYSIDTSDSAGRIDVCVRETMPLENGGRLLRLKITDFAPDIDTGYIQLRDRDFIEEALRHSPVQLIDYVMIDNAYDGEFRCRSIREDTSEEMAITATGSLKLIAVDVFGREYDGGVF